MSSQNAAGAFAPSAPDSNAFTDGPPWHTDIVQASLGRISSAPTLEAAHVQAATEQVVLLHSIRRILVWTLILLPVILTAIGIIVLVLGQPTSAPSTLYP